MKTKYCLFLLLLMALGMPSTAYSQCADIFKKGVASMEAKKYKSAISYFQKAKECDKNLTKQCDEKIRECRKYINPTPNTPSTKSQIITLEKEYLEFGAEETNAKPVKVLSEMEWRCTTDANWCTVTKMDGKRLSIECQINKTPEKRTADIQVINKKETKSIKVTQKGQDAILNIIPDILQFGKEEQEYVKIHLDCTVKYNVKNWPEWVKILDEYEDKIIIKVEPFKEKKQKIRKGYISIESEDGSLKDYMDIEQYKELQQPASKDANAEKKEQKSSGRQYLFNFKKDN